MEQKEVNNMRRLDIICVCGFGLGTSLILKMQLDEVFKDAGIDAEVTPCDISSATGQNADIFFTSAEFHDQLQASTSAPVVEVHDFLDKAALHQVAVPAVKKLLEQM